MWPLLNEGGCRKRSEILELKLRAWKKKTEKLGRQRSLCLTANKLFSTTGLGTETAKGLVHCLTASTKEVQRELGSICSILLMSCIILDIFTESNAENNSTTYFIF